MTADLGFANPLRFAHGSHFGIVIARFPNELSAKETTRQLASQLRLLTNEDYRGSIVIVEPARVRIRRA